MHRVVHLIDDPQVGGVLTGLQKLISAETQLPGQHEMLVVNSASPWLAYNITAETIVVHFAIAWRKIPFLFWLRLNNLTANLVLQEHHYCAEHLTRQGGSHTRFRSLFQIASKLFDKILAVSEAQALWLQGLGAQVDLVVAPMADISDLLSIPIRLPTKRPTVGISGRFCEDKGIDLLLELLERPAAQSFHFLIAGYGELEAEVVLAAQRHSNVEFIGRYNKPLEFLDRCDVVLIPSRQETFGLNCLEAKAAAKPVVVTRCGGLTEQATSCGVVVDQINSAALICGLWDLQKLPLLRELGARGRQEAERHNTLVQSLWCQALNEESAR